MHLLSAARAMLGMVMISGYDTDLYNDMLNGWAKLTKEARISAERGTKVRTECLWINPQAQQAERAV